MGEIDLDRLAGGYGHRLSSEEGRARARRAASEAGLGVGDVAVDVGGGRGRHAAVLAETGATAIVVDRSPAMAAAARTSGVEAIIGDGGALPIAPGSAALVHYHASIHYGDPHVWLGEAARVVRPGGTVWVWNFDRDTVMDGFLARWFPTVGVIDSVRFPATGTVIHAMERAGLGRIQIERDVERIERTAADWIAAVEAGFVSTLQLIDPSELQSGLAAFAARYPDPEEIVHYEVSYVAVWGRREQ